jgi:hypothetical protein
MDSRENLFSKTDAGFDALSRRQSSRRFSRRPHSSHQPSPDENLIKATMDELKEDYETSSALYYVNGREVMLNPRSLEEFNFDDMLPNTDAETVKYIKKNFNKRGFKTDVVDDAAVDYSIYERKMLRYDFIENGKGGVTFVTRFKLTPLQLNLRDDGSYLSENTFEISRDNFGIKPVRSLNIPLQSRHGVLVCGDNKLLAQGSTLDEAETALDSRLSVLEVEERKVKGEGRWFSRFAAVFYVIYPSDSYVFGSDLFNGKRISNIPGTDEPLPQKHSERMKRNIKRYYLHPLIMLLSFLGLPNACEPGEALTLNKFFWNMLGWQNNKPIWVNVLLAVPSAIKNTLAFFLTAPWNMLRLVSEFLPALLASGCYWAAIASQKKGNTYLSWLAYAGVAIFDVIFWVGGAVTSPLDSIFYAWRFAMLTARKFDEHWSKTLLRVLAGLILVSLSAAISASVYVFLFPSFFNVIYMMSPDLAVQLFDLMLPVLSFMGTIFAGVVADAMTAGFAMLLAVSAVFGAGIKQGYLELKERWANWTIKDAAAQAPARIELSSKAEILQFLREVEAEAQEKKPVPVMRRRFSRRLSQKMDAQRMDEFYGADVAEKLRKSSLFAGEEERVEEVELEEGLRERMEV